MKADMKPTLLLAAMLMLAHPHAHAAESATAFDMVDLRLGMTLAQAKKALLAYDPAMRITEERSHYVYGDGAGGTLKTPDFVAYINGDRKVGASGSEGIALYFTPMPGDQKVVAIVRTLHNMPDPPTGRQYRDSLTKKYGKPVKAGESRERRARALGVSRGSSELPGERQLRSRLRPRKRDAISAPDFPGRRAGPVQQARHQGLVAMRVLPRIQRRTRNAGGRVRDGAHGRRGRVCARRA